MNPLATQIGGSHYKDLAIQPAEYCHVNRLGFIEGCVVKYVTRWREKGGVDDLKKARHFLDIMIELEAKDSLRSQIERTIPGEGELIDPETLAVGEWYQTRWRRDSNWGHPYKKEPDVVHHPDKLEYRRASAPKKL